MTDRKLNTIIALSVIAGIILLVVFFWGARGLSLERSFVYQAVAKESNMILGARETAAHLDFPYISVHPRTSPYGEWKTITASWYDREHCLGCRKDRLMANGEKLDDAAMTCAYNGVKLGTKIKIRYQDKEAECVVADRVGKQGRIDLTPAVFNKLSNLKVGLLEVLILE